VRVVASLVAVVVTNDHPVAVDGDHDGSHVKLNS